MSSTKDLEKADAGTTGTMRTESTAYQSDNEKLDEVGDISPGALGQPDEGHAEIEQMDDGHMEDLELRHVCLAPSFHEMDNKLTPMHRLEPELLSKQDLENQWTRMQSREYNLEPAQKADCLE